MMTTDSGFCYVNDHVMC